MPETIRQHLDRAVWFSDMGRSGSATKEIKAALRILDGCKRDAEIKRLRSVLQIIADGYEEWSDEPDTVNWGTTEIDRDEMMERAAGALVPDPEEAT